MIVTRITKNGKDKPFSLGAFKGDFYELGITLSFFFFKNMTVLEKARYSMLNLLNLNYLKYVKYCACSKSILCVYTCT